MQHSDLLLQHLDETFATCVNLEHTFEIYVDRHCNICTIQIYFYIYMKHLQHTSEKTETLEIYVCNMCFQRNISLLLGRMEAHRRIEFTGVELADNEKLGGGTQRGKVGAVRRTTQRAGGMTGGRLDTTENTEMAPRCLCFSALA
jgi:hypothetical protein